MTKFHSGAQFPDFFTYVGNSITIEHVIGAIGILQPDFVHLDDCVFWCPDAREYDTSQAPKAGLKSDSSGKLIKSSDRGDIERYANNISINQFFFLWPGAGDEPVLKVGLNPEEYEICHAFARQIERYWTAELEQAFPNKSFCFEIGDDILDEYGVCITFYQND